MESAAILNVPALGAFIQSNIDRLQDIVMVGQGADPNWIKLVPWSKVASASQGEVETKWLEIDAFVGAASDGHKGYDGTVFSPSWGARPLPTPPMYIKTLELIR